MATTAGWWNLNSPSTSRDWKPRVNCSSWQSSPPATGQVSTTPQYPTPCPNLSSQPATPWSNCKSTASSGLRQRRCSWPQVVTNSNRNRTSRDRLRRLSGGGGAKTTSPVFKQLDAWSRLALSMFGDALAHIDSGRECEPWVVSRSRRRTRSLPVLGWQGLVSGNLTQSERAPTI